MSETLRSDRHAALEIAAALSARRAVPLMAPPLRWNQWRPGQGWQIVVLGLFDLALIAYLVAQVVFR